MIAVLFVVCALAFAEAPIVPIAAPATTPAAPVIPSVEAVRASLVVQVDDRDAAIAALIAEAESRRGWFQSLRADGVTLRVPVAEAEATVSAARALGRVVDRTWGRESLGTQIVDARAALAGREAVLATYFEVLGSASVEAVVAVESEIDRTIREIETYRGRIRALEHRGANATIDVAFRFRERSAPAPDGNSAFAWVNQVDLGRLLRDFRGGALGPKHTVARPVAPDGFATWDKKRRFRAVSSDDVVYRVRTVRNKPKADLEFWREAVRRRLIDAGYRLVAESDVAASGAPGALLELSAPDGERDATGLVAVFVDGNAIVVLEAAGEAARFAKAKDAVLAAMKATRL